MASKSIAAQQRAAETGIMPFNMAIMHYVRISKLSEAKDFAFVRQDLNASYKLINAIYKAIIFKIKKDDRKKIKKKLDFVKNRLYSSHHSRSPNIELNRDKKCFSLLDEIDIELITIMDKNNMIFPKVKGHFGLDILNNKYGL